MAKTIEEEFYEQARAFRTGKRKEYPDILRKPQFVVREALPPPGSGAKPTQAQLRYQEIVEQQIKARWNILFKTFDIRPNEPSSWELLARALGEKYVPGVRTTDKWPEQKRPGHPRRWDPRFSAEFWLAFNEARARVAKEEKKAVEEVTILTTIENLDPKFRDKCKGPRGKPLSDRYLAKQYNELRKMAEGLTWELTPLEELGIRAGILQKSER